MVGARFGPAGGCFASVVLMTVLSSALPVFGNTITVASLNDSGTGSLREAIASAASGDTINFSVTGTITLASTVTISTNLTISGPGASNLAISGNNSVRVFVIDGGITATISGVTIQNGSVGGDWGGGIYIASGSTLILSNSTLSGNSSGYAGAGIGSFGTLNVTNSTLSGNSAASYGGGINNDGGTLTVTSSTLSGNSAGYEGGGINQGNGAATLTVTNSTLSGNSASYGGGIFSFAPLTVTNSTLTGNSAAAYGGGILQLYGSATLKNTIVANSPLGGNCFGSSGTFTSQGHNLSDDTTCSSFFNQTGDINSTPAGLDPSGLQYNGGPTQTIALLATSPAVDAIPVSACTDVNLVAIAIDQRGIPRPQGPACDIGAFELVQNPVQAAQTLISAVQTSGLPKGTQQALSSALQGALISLSKGNNTATIHQLQAFINQVKALLQSGRLISGQAAALIGSAQQIIQSLGG